MKKIISIMLALILVLSMTIIAFADDGEGTGEVITGEGEGEDTGDGNENPTEDSKKKNQDASFSKTYKITNEGTSNPEETFTFKFTANHVTDTNVNPDIITMPTIPNSTITFKLGDATTGNGSSKDVAVALANIKWPGVGVYYYKVNEVAGTTAGVKYDNTTAYLKVTVAYDEGTDTYYTAFVTMNLNDKDDKGNTKNKTGGFTNVYEAGSLSIRKNVTGNMGDQSREFDVTVTFTQPDTKKVNGEITYTKGTETKTIAAADWSDNKATVTIKLKHNETITFDNIPYGVKYTVVEADYTTDANGKYDAPSYSLNGTDGTTTSITNAEIDSALDTVTITNNKGTVVDTGISLDSIPYVLTLAVVCAGAFVFFSKKRAAREN